MTTTLLIKEQTNCEQTPKAIKLSFTYVKCIEIILELHNSPTEIKKRRDLVAALHARSMTETQIASALKKSGYFGRPVNCFPRPKEYKGRDSARICFFSGSI